MDACEDVAGGLNMVVDNLSWEETSLKTCVLLADSPSHGKQYHEYDGF